VTGMPAADLGASAEGATVLASYAAGPRPEEARRIHEARARALAARGDADGAAQALQRSRTPGQWSTSARSEVIRAQRQAES
jgi:hypothetical protein